MIAPFYTLCTQLVSRISQYPSFCKIMFKKNTLFLKKHYLKKIDTYLIRQTNRVCTFYIITPFYKLCTQLVRGRIQYPTFLKVMTCQKITLFPKKQDFLKNAICLINQINQVCAFYIITPFYRLCTQLVSEITYYHSYLKSRTSK